MNSLTGDKAFEGRGNPNEIAKSITRFQLFKKKCFFIIGLGGLAPYCFERKMKYKPSMKAQAKPLLMVSERCIMRTIYLSCFSETW